VPDVYDSILYEVDDPVATVTLNRPESLNAWTGTMDREVRDAVERAAADRSVVAIVITGAGRGFCAGADMSTLQSLSSDDAGTEGLREDGMWWTSPDGEFGGRFSYLMAIDKPVIAAVNGAVAGMAYPLTLCCDLRIGTPEALFVTAFAERGLIAEWGLSWLLPRLVGPAVALDLLFTSRRVGGEEAHRIGLLSHLVEPDDLLPSCRRYVEHLASTTSPASMAVMKRQVYEQLHAGLGAAERDSQRLMLESFGRSDFAEGVRAFTEKRPPEFPRIGD
jgi:enoyl-CoA hydratase/carnithine racemase